MKVKIFTECGKNIGLGHISRCSSLYDEIAKKKIDVELIIAGDINGVSFLNHRNVINKNWIERNFLYENITSEDYSIIDSYIASVEIYEIIARLSRKVLYIDDIGRLCYPQGIILNPSLDASDIQYSCENKNELLVGASFVILRPSFIHIKREFLQKKIRKVLITMGGTDIRNLTSLIVNEFCVKRPDLFFYVINGSYELELYGNKFDHIQFFTNIHANKMKELMLEADLAITAAGQTIYELLATQTPFIPIQIVENQENNIHSLLKYNPNQMVLKYDDRNLIENLNQAFEIASDLDYRREQNGMYENLIDGCGSQRVIDQFLMEISG